MNKPKYNYFWLAVTAENKDGLYAYAIRVSDCEDVAWKLSSIVNLKHANIMPTKKKAREVVDCWNESYKRNGTYAFSTPLF